MKQETISKMKTALNVHLKKDMDKNTEEKMLDHIYEIVKEEVSKDIEMVDLATYAGGVGKGGF